MALSASRRKIAPKWLILRDFTSARASLGASYRTGLGVQ